MSFFCLWIEQFPAWAISQSEPSLAKQPFAVCEKGRVVAASPSAIAQGVAPKMSSAKAKSRCASLQIIPRDSLKEELAWVGVQRTLSAFTSRIEAVHPGLLFADVEGKPIVPTVAKWNARGGQATDRSTAHLAALTSNTGRVRAIRPGDEAGFAEEIDEFHPDADLIFAMVEEHSEPFNLKPVAQWSAPEEVAAHLSFELPCREAGEWQPGLSEILSRVCQQMGARSAQSIEIIADTIIGPVAARRVLNDPLSEASRLETPALSALETVLETLFPLPPVLLGIEVRLGSLTNAVMPAPAWQSAPVAMGDRLRGALEKVESRFRGVVSPPIVSHFVPRETEQPLVEGSPVFVESEVQSVAEVKRAAG